MNVSVLTPQSARAWAIRVRSRIAVPQSHAVPPGFPGGPDAGGLGAHGRREVPESPGTCRHYREDAARQVLGEAERQRPIGPFMCRLKSIDHDDDACSGFALVATFGRFLYHRGQPRRVAAGPGQHAARSQVMQFPGCYQLCAQASHDGSRLAAPAGARQNEQHISVPARLSRPEGGLTQARLTFHGKVAAVGHLEKVPKLLHQQIVRKIGTVEDLCIRPVGLRRFL